MSDKYCVYCHTNKINNKKYFGITSQSPNNRWRKGEGYKNNEYFYRSITKYGWINFEHTILFTGLSKEEAELKEIALIKEYDSANPQKGYNIELGGNSTEKFNPEIRAKISKALKGHKCSEETRKKLSESHKGQKSPFRGRKWSPEMIEKNRQAHLGKIPWNKGRSWTESEKARLKNKPVYCVELNKTYPTATMASKELGINNAQIGKCAKGKVKTAGGYHWRYPEKPASDE